MSDPIYVIDPQTKATVQVEPTTFYELKVKERQDLQSWLMLKPEVLGEALLLVTSEFDRFDKSDKRLDLLLLDKGGTLVVAELKLDASGTLADQQAIRYAAFCSTMTMEDVVTFYARTAGKSYEDGATDVCDFLEVSELTELKGEPRIMLVAGAFADQELTATVMWLRKFGLDISCVELTPYRYPGDESHILLVPKVLIPLSEAREYQVGIERKERNEQAVAARNDYSAFFREVLVAYADLRPEVPGPSNPSAQGYMSLQIGKGHIHYEWLVIKRAKFVDVALHFEANDLELNRRRIDAVLQRCPNLAAATTYELSSGSFHQKWTQISYRIPYQGGVPGQEVAIEAARVMNILVSQTLQIVRDLD